MSETETLLLRFDVAAVLPSNVTAEQIGKATLTLWVSKIAAQGYCGVYPVTSQWGENNRA